MQRNRLSDQIADRCGAISCDALHILITEGMLVRDPGQHMVVTPVSRQDLQDPFATEGMLAGYAAERASRNADTPDLNVLDQLHQAMLAAAQRGDLEQMSELNWRFHRRINRLVASRRRIARGRPPRWTFPHLHADVPEAGRVSDREDAAILARIGEKRHDHAKGMMIDHTARAGEGLIAYLETVTAVPR